MNRFIVLLLIFVSSHLSISSALTNTANLFNSEKKATSLFFYGRAKLQSIPIDTSTLPRVIENYTFTKNEILIRIINDNFGNLEAERSNTDADKQKFRKLNAHEKAIGYFRGDNGNGAFKYFISNHHLPLPKGYIVWDNTQIFYNQLLFSLSDYLNLSLDYIPINSFGWRSNFTLTPSVTLPFSDFISIGFGSSFFIETPLMPTETTSENIRMAGSYFFGITMGDADHNFSLTYFDPFNRNISWRENFWLAPDTEPMLKIGTVGKIKPHWSFVSELFFQESGRSYFLGFKSHYYKWHFDYGVAVDNGSIFPYLGFQIYIKQPPKEPVRRPNIFRNLFH